MLTGNTCVDALGTLGLLAATTVAPHENDLSGPLSDEQLAMADNVSVCGVNGSSAEAPTVADRGVSPVLAVAEAGESASEPLASALRFAAHMRPQLFLVRARLARAVASAWVPGLVAGGMATRHRCIAFARAEANAVRISESAANSRPAKTADQRLDALARLANAIKNCRLDAWILLAELRAAACMNVETSELASARREFAYVLRGLNILATRRQQALHDGGKAEAVFQLKMNRSRRAAELSDLWLDRARYMEDRLFIEEGKAAYELISIKAGIYRYRADAWGHIADCHERSARGLMPDPAAFADLHHCRVRVAELSAELPAATAEVGVEGESQTSNELLSAFAADAPPDNAIAKANYAPVFTLSPTVTIDPSALCDGVPF